MTSNDRIEEQESSIEEFLRKRAEIDQTIREKFQREITVMFTDIASSTEFYEVYGDIEGRAMIQRHNDLLGPIIEQFGGRVLRALGDGFMATFDKPPEAARAAVKIQNTMAAENLGKNPSEQIWVKVAIHHGLGIVEKGDVYGDIINTLARICALTRQGDVLVSQAYADLIKDEPDIHYDYVGVKNLRGKSTPVEVYRIIWDPAQMQDLTRSAEIERPGLEPSEGTLRLHFALQGERLRLAVFPNGKQAQIVKHVREFPYREAEIRNLVEAMNQCVVAVDKRGSLHEEKLLRLKELGKTLLGMLIPEDIEKFILEKQAANLLLQIDVGLVYIPWELLHNGEEFFCIRYSMGRIIFSSEQPLAKGRDLGRRPLKILLVADPKGDLAASKNEGISVQRELSRSDCSNELSADLRSQEVTTEFFASQLGEYELLHYAGHFEYDRDDPSRSGLVLADGRFEVGRLLSLARESALPSLVFTNACQSGRTEQWSSGERLYGLANAFLVSGVRHYIGGTRDIFDRASAAFAEEFYRQLIANQSVGEALRQARIKSIRRYGEKNLAWASYVLYGDPSFRYFELCATPAKATTKQKPRSATTIAVSLAAILLIALGCFLLGRMWSERAARERLAREGFNLVHAGQLAKAEEVFSELEGKSPLFYQGMSAIYLNRGNLEKAEDNLVLAQQNQPKARYLGVMRAHLALSQGKLDESEVDYRKALETQGLEGWQQAECHYGLGRVFLARGDLVQAAAEFDQAVRLDPSFLQAYTAKGLALERLGKPRDALDLYQKAAGINGADPINAVLYRKCKELLDYRESAEHKARVDQLIADLVTTYREGSRPSDDQDEWSSRPLYLFFLNLQTKGQPAPREGEDAYISELIAGNLNSSTRIRTVERGLLDRLLEELKLSSSQLADPQTALRLGKILSARILATGTLVRYKGQLQVNLRAIDTENTRVTATASGTSPFSEDPEKMLQTLAREFQGRVVSAYPIRGRVTEVQPGEWVLNVGSAMGVTAGMKLRLVEPDMNGVELVVNEVSETTCKAVPSSDEIEVEAGWRVEEI